ncbi:hypothetical protein [Cohnella silvisoli]|uniref:Uncharacterized protein n=1 Tax=Cohnella silvisoli TaxID=2873699 RepID=A0ABV1KWE0_9BACL|nr:hypothetical protein [Cohnella silvisoli]MCD9023757.1 hypothetical protein [Cohnella silvisoli]
MSALLPGWLNEKLGLRWHGDGSWNEVEMSGALYAADGAIWMASVGGVHIEVRLDWEPNMAAVGESVAAVEVSVFPSVTGEMFSGIQLYMVNDSSLRCVWKPHLAPLDGMVIGDKMFRSPAIVFEDETTMAALIPDLDVIQQHRIFPHMMDYSVQDNTLMYGLCEYTETGHVYHWMTPQSRILTEPLVFRFYLAEWGKGDGQRPKDFRAVERFLWDRFGSERMPVSDALGNEEDSLAALEPYANHAYEWALDRWKDVTWQQFTLENGTEAGGVVFIVRAKQKPGLGSEEEWREPKSLWNQAWFCGLRTAYGYGWWGRQQGRADWVDKAELALNFALSAPQMDGLFPGYYQAGEGNRWETGSWFMSGPRRPAGHEEHVHLLDSSWTCWWLLKWYRDVNKDERIFPFVTRYVERLLKLQKEDGSFPAWVRPDGSGTSPFLTESPESSVHVMLLCLLNQVVQEAADSRYIAAAESAARFVVDRIVPEGRWEDFETYWSCSKQWDGKLYGELDARSGLYNQCNFGIYWTAEALKDLYVATGNPEWLDYGEQVLAEASLYQQIWQPPYFPVPTIGGFGVMTSDDEWNDARQSLFALTYWDYYRLTGNESYRARALWAMKASFYMMYCPENAAVKEIYERVHPHFDERDYGFHMENFNHHDGTPVDGLGEFTIFDWGCGAAAASLAEFRMKVSVTR